MFTQTYSCPNCNKSWENSYALAYHKCRPEDIASPDFFNESGSISQEGWDKLKPIIQADGNINDTTLLEDIKARYNNYALVFGNPVAAEYRADVGYLLNLIQHEIR